MNTRASLEETLRNLLSADLHPQVPTLAMLLSEAIKGTVPVSTIQDLLGLNSQFQPIAVALAGKQIDASGGKIAFGEGGQLGDVTVNDVAGGNIVRLTINIFNSPNTGHINDNGKQKMPFKAASDSNNPVLNSQSAPQHRLLKVFLCHSSKDKLTVRKLYNQLIQEGIQPWLDEEDLIPGQDWQREISKAVRLCDIFLVCLSISSINKSGYVQKEIRFALEIAEELPEETIYIVPLRLEDCDVPERLLRWHWVNYYEEAGYQRLIRAFRLREISLGIGRTLEASSTKAQASLPEEAKGDNFIYLDTTQISGEGGRKWRAPLDFFSSISDLLNDLYMQLIGEVSVFSYGSEWVMRDVKTGYVFTGMGKRYLDRNGKLAWDERTLADVGIYPGISLEIILVHLFNREKPA